MYTNADDCVLKVLTRKSGLSADQISMESRLLQDIGLDGDDAMEAIQEISMKCSMDISNFDFTQYFRSEPSLLSLLWFLPSHKKNRINEKCTITVGQLIDAARKGYLGT
jgi:hypothetical protein